MKPIGICLRCSNKTCEKYPNNELHFCQYDIAFVKINDTILRKEALLPLRHISENLRHAMNPVLNVIVEQLNSMDPMLSHREWNQDTPVGKIFSATIIIDLFIQMISGVNEFKPSIDSSQHDPPRRLNDIIRKYYSIYSILKSARRNPKLPIDIEVPESIYIQKCTDIYEYIISILIDNAWKYSTHNTGLKIEMFKRTKSTADIYFINESAPIQIDVELFTKGFKAVKGTEGFGYGLFWAHILKDYYNRLIDNPQLHIELNHTQTMISDHSAIQKFILKNLYFIEKVDHEKSTRSKNWQDINEIWKP